MTLYVFKFLFVVCFLLSLALLWRLDWFPVLAPWEIRSKRERDWVRSPFMFLAIPTSRRWGEGLLHDCVFPGLRTDLPSSKYKVLDLLIQYSCRGKEERENW